MQHNSSSHISISIVLNGIFVVVVLLSLVLVARAQPETTTEISDAPVDCLKILLRAAKSTMKSLTVCSQMVKENTTSSKEYGDKLSCIMKCAMNKINLLNDKFEIDDHSVERMMQKYVPNPRMLDEVRIRIVGACASFAKKFDPNDQYCKSYAEYVLCLQTAVEDFKENSRWCIKKPKKKTE